MSHQLLNITLMKPLQLSLVAWNLILRIKPLHRNDFYIGFLIDMTINATGK